MLISKKSLLLFVTIATMAIQPYAFSGSIIQIQNNIEQGQMVYVEINNQPYTNDGVKTSTGSLKYGEAANISLTDHLEKWTRSTLKITLGASYSPQDTVVYIIKPPVDASGEPDMRFESSTNKMFKIQLKSTALPYILSAEKIKPLH